MLDKLFLGSEKFILSFILLFPNHVLFCVLVYCKYQSPVVVKDLGALT